MMLASELTDSLICWTISSTSKSSRSLPPVILINTPVAFSFGISSNSGFLKAKEAAMRARSFPRAISFSFHRQSLGLSLSLFQQNEIGEGEESRRRREGLTSSHDSPRGALHDSFYICKVQVDETRFDDHVSDGLYSFVQDIIDQLEGLIETFCRGRVR